MNKAATWAASYFQRLDSAIEALTSHPLINHLRYVRFPGATEDEVSATAAGMAERHEDDEPGKAGTYRLDDYMKAFYRISNGLNIAWDSHIVPSSLAESNVARDAPKEDFVVAKDELLQAEGFLALLPLQNLVSYAGLNIGGDPRDSSLGTELSEQGAHFTYLDFYSAYHDTCIAVSPQGAMQNLLYPGEDHSAAYDADRVSDFVIYMEYLLATFFSVPLRRQAFHTKETIGELRRDDYAGLSAAIASDNEYSDIDAVLKYHALDEEMLEKFGDLEILQSKPAAVYTAIEELLDVVLEDEL